MGITIQLPPSSPQFLDSRFKFHRIAKLNHTCVGHRIYPPFSSRQPLLCHSVLDAATHNILAMISVAAATATISRTDESNSHSQLVCACVCLAHSQADRRFYCISWHAYYAQPHLNHIHARLHGQNGQISRKTNGWRYINSKELQRIAVIIDAGTEISYVFLRPMDGIYIAIEMLVARWWVLFVSNVSSLILASIRKIEFFVCDDNQKVRNCRKITAPATMTHTPPTTRQQLSSK